MRVELIYSPGCITYKKALDVLETVIAEERLPIAIEMQEESARLSPGIRINGTELGEPSHTFEGDPCCFGVTTNPCVTQLRTILSAKWRELTAPA
jgi:hypothetical protein